MTADKQSFGENKVPTIESAGEEHLPGIFAIYNHAVEHSTAIWNDALVDLENRRFWWRGRIEAGLPVLVAVADGQVLGDANYGPFCLRQFQTIIKSDAVRAR
jgi:L-amino acid N-acyltransferase YncA